MIRKLSYNTDVNSLVKQHEVASGMQISKKREDVYNDKKLRPAIFKAMKKQSLPLTPISFKLL